MAVAQVNCKTGDFRKVAETLGTRSITAREAEASIEVDLCALHFFEIVSLVGCDDLEHGVLILRLDCTRDKRPAGDGNQRI